LGLHALFKEVEIEIEIRLWVDRDSGFKDDVVYELSKVGNPEFFGIV
jgi:hypothetical protein